MNGLELVTAVLSIVVIDLTLSGDNAVVIGMAAHNLPAKQRRLAIIFGASGAIVLRVLFAALAATLLTIPLLQAAGGLILAWIAFKLLRDEEPDPNQTTRQSGGLAGAVKVIILADAVMSLDNILAVGGASHGNIELLVFGLALSMPIVMFGSSLIAGMMGKARWLTYVGAVVLAWTSGQMLLEDRVVGPLLPDHWALEYGIPIAIACVVLAFSHRWKRAHAPVRVRA